MSLVEYIPTVLSRDHRNNIESAVRAINISNKHKTANASIKACLNGSNIVGPTSSNNVTIIDMTASLSNLFG